MKSFAGADLGARRRTRTIRANIYIVGGQSPHPPTQFQVDSNSTSEGRLGTHKRRYQESQRSGRVWRWQYRWTPLHIGAPTSQYESSGDSGTWHTGKGPGSWPL